MSYNPGTPATPGYGIPPTPGPMYGDQPPATPGPIYGNSGASYSYAPATPGPQISYGHTPGPASNTGMRGPPSNAVASVKRMNVADQQPQSVQSEYPPATPRSALDNGVQSPQIQNIVATVDLDCGKLDLKSIAMRARNAEYNPKRFAAVIMRIREPRTTALIFSSGKMVCTGAKSEEKSRLAARKYARVIQKLGFPAKFKDFKIQNMVGSVDVKFAIRLEQLVLNHAQFTSFEPELFPGLVYRMIKPKLVLLIFVSGKVVLTGAKQRKEIDDAFNNIYPILRKFRKQQ